MVARAGARYSTRLSSVSDRSRPGILSRLCLSLAAREEQRISAARSTPDARTNWRPRAVGRNARASRLRDGTTSARDTREDRAFRRPKHKQPGNGGLRSSERKRGGLEAAPP